MRPGRALDVTKTMMRMMETIFRLLSQLFSFTFHSLHIFIIFKISSSKFPNFFLCLLVFTSHRAGCCWTWWRGKLFFCELVLCEAFDQVVADVQASCRVVSVGSVAAHKCLEHQLRMKVMFEPRAMLELTMGIVCSKHRLCDCLDIAFSLVP